MLLFYSFAKILCINSLRRDYIILGMKVTMGDLLYVYVLDLLSIYVVVYSDAIVVLVMTWFTLSDGLN